MVSRQRGSRPPHPTTAGRRHSTDRAAVLPAEQGGGPDIPGLILRGLGPTGDRDTPTQGNKFLDRSPTDPETGVAPGRPGAAMCVQDIDVQCVLQFTLIHAAGCALHRLASRVIHRSEFCFRTFNHTGPGNIGSSGSDDSRPFMHQ